jgi:putative transposase
LAWSSARSHIASRRTGEDPLTDIAALGQHVPNWRAMLEIGLEAMDEAAAIAEIEARTRARRPLASPDWIVKAEADMQRKLGPARRGPKPKERVADGSLGETTHNRPNPSRH